MKMYSRTNARLVTQTSRSFQASSSTSSFQLAIRRLSMVRLDACAAPYEVDMADRLQCVPSQRQRCVLEAGFGIPGMDDI